MALDGKGRFFTFGIKFLPYLKIKPDKSGKNAVKRNKKSPGPLGAGLII
jgi:hypothetical protein